MTICKKCNGYIPDISNTPHNCGAGQSDYFEPKRSKYAVKCDMCGSTAIDHTENQCQINRQLKKL